MNEVIWEARGMVSEIQRFSLHDGPGIRTIVFLKGCPLRCSWCSNPETQAPDSQLMVQEDNCVSCGRCANVCPAGAISYQPKVTVNRLSCVSCGLCSAECGSGALTMNGKEMSTSEIVSILRKDEAYYRRSGGGITLSGGEPLYQSDFVLNLLRACKDQGWNTAIETTAFCNPAVLDNVLPLLDTVLLDIKHMEDSKHYEYVQQSNSLILENARRIAGQGAQMIIRVPVVPGFNDTIHEIAAIASFAAELPGVRELHLLPFHRLGENKYTYLGTEYHMKHQTPPPSDEMESLRHVAEGYGLRCQIGG